MAVSIPAQQGQESDRTIVASAIAFYAFCSSTLLVLNKLAVFHAKSSSFVIITQLVASAVVVKILQRTNGLKVDALEEQKVKSFIPIALVFAVALYTNVKTLEYANVETVIVFRSLTPLAVSVGDYFFLNRELPSYQSFGAMAAIVIGASIYVMTDDGFEVTAYSWAVLYLGIIVFEMLYVKHVMNTVEMTTWGRVYYNNLLSIPPVFLFGVVMNEFQKLAEVEFDQMTIIALGLAMLAGVGMSYAGFNLRAMVSATSFTLVGVLCKLATILINVTIWDQHANGTGIFALIVCVLAGTLYRQAPLRKEAPENLPGYVRLDNLTNGQQEEE
eukprot:Clim_evm37s253 gene=Clim_evmTU37s253